MGPIQPSKKRAKELKGRSKGESEDVPRKGSRGRENLNTSSLRTVMA